MLKILEIEGLLSHKKTKFQLHEGVNVLSGDSDSGKSAAMQAIEWVLFNYPDGWGFKSWFPDTRRTKVTAEFDDHKIVRTRSTQLNTYQVDNELLKKVGTRLPEKVAEASGISRINFQTQHGKYFLLEDTPGKVAEYLNSLVGLSIIDELTSEVASIGRTIKTQLEIEQANMSRLETDMLQFEDLDRRSALLEEALSIEGQLSHYKQSEEELQSLQIKWIDLQNKINVVTDWLEIIPNFCSISLILDDLEKLEAKTVRLEALEANFSRLNSSLETLNSWLGVRGGFDILKALEAKLEALKDKDEKLTTLAREFVNKQTKLISCNDKLHELKQEYKDVISEYGVCPVCGNDIDEEHLERILHDEVTTNQ